MPHRSAASLSIVRDDAPRRLQPPTFLSKAARLEFIEIVNAASVQHFVDSDRPLVASLAQANIMVRTLAKS